MALSASSRWQRLEEIKAFMRMGGNASDLKAFGWNGDSNGNGMAKQLSNMPGIVQDSSGDLHFAEWNCRAGQNNVIIRTDGTVAPCFRCILPHSTGATSIMQSSTMPS